MMVERDPSEELKAENARLIALLEANGIRWRIRQPESSSPGSAPEPSRLSTDEKVALFRRLFRGRTDVYPIRWEGKTTTKSGYSPACANEWRAGVCEKPRMLGYFSLAGYRPAMPVAWAQPSSATLAREPDN